MAATIPAHAPSILDEVYGGLASGSLYSSMNRLRTGLTDLRNTLSSDEWHAFCRCTMPQHPIQQVLRQSPIPGHRCHSPVRSVLGSNTLDLIFGPPSVLRGATTLGRMLYSWECALPFSDALRLREAVIHIELARADHEHLRPRVLPLVHHPATTKLSGSFDFIYASHLFDTLETRQARALVRALVDLLAPNGRLLLANMAPEIPDAAYLEACLNCWPNYRSEQEMARLADEVPEKHISSQCVFRDEEGHSVFLELQKSAYA